MTCDHKLVAAAAMTAVVSLCAAITMSAQGFVAPGTTKKGPGAKTWLAERAKLPPYAPPRMADGKPNLQGRWGGSSSGDDIEETEQVDPTTPQWESYVSNPANGRVPYQPWAMAERIKHRAGLARGVPGETGNACTWIRRRSV